MKRKALYIVQLLLLAGIVFLVSVPLSRDAMQVSDQQSLGQQTQNLDDTSAPAPNQPEVIIIQSGAPPPSGDVLDDLLLDHPSACLNGPVAQFGRYVGDWDIAEQTVSSDGETWVAGNGARWKFSCIGGGKAVQDYWVPNGPDGESFLYGFGSNFRIYDPITDSWDTVWAGPGGPSFTHIKGKQDADGNIVMHWVSPMQDPPRRITFFPPANNAWDWLLEMSYDDGATWQPVYKIKATKRR